jgi:transcription elongation GreA/GreB family factor
MDRISLKKQLKQFALDQIERRLVVAREAIAQAQEAANQEEKSSAGDKYETGRAMSHLQKDMHARQLLENQKERADLQGIPVDMAYNTVRAGAFIQTETGDFFIAAGLGKQMHEGKVVVFLSPQAPLARLLYGKAAGEQVSLNGKTVKITEVF